MSKKKKIIISVIAVVLIMAVIVSAVVIAMTKGKNAAKASGVYANLPPKDRITAIFIWHPLCSSWLLTRLLSLSVIL